MKQLITAAIVAIGLATPAFAADPLEGQWLTKPDDNGNFGLIQVAPCGAALCGTLIAAYGSDGAQIETDNVGKQIISETVAQGNGEYTGKVYAPDRDKTYNSKLMLSGDTLAVSGCVLGICRDGGTWTRR